MGDKRETKRGMLAKRAQGKSTLSRMNWKDRYFVLTDSELSYWDKFMGDTSDGTKKGEIVLREVRGVELVDESALQRPCSFQTIYGMGNDPWILYAQAPDEKDRDSWVQAIRERVASNAELLSNFHPGLFVGKWTCCSGTKTSDGCKEAFNYASLRGGAGVASTRSPNEPLPPRPSQPGELQSTNSVSSMSSIQSQPLPQIPSGGSSTSLTYNTLSRTPTVHGSASGSSSALLGNGGGSPGPASGAASAAGTPRNAYLNTPQVAAAPAPAAVPSKAPGLFDVVAMFPHTATEPRDLSINVGDKLSILECSEQHWWLARNALGLEGYVPRNYVSRVSIESEPWYKGKISRPEAAFLLRSANQEGTFLVRDSESKAGEYSLSVSHGESLRHYHIKYSDNMYFIHDRHKFTDIPSLIEYHKHNSGGLVTRLRKSVADVHAQAPTMIDSKYEIDPAEVTLGRELGSGQFGVVREGTYRGQRVAVKMMKEGAMSEDDFISEAKIMKDLTNPNLVQLFGVCTTQRPIYIVTELMTQGCLLDFLRKYEPSLTTKPEVIHYMSIQVSRAMTFLEENMFIHRDLAARNCLVSDNYVVKVADFGLARFVLDDEYTASQGTKFPIKWAAPEVIQFARFSTKSDVWSFGILMWELWSLGRVPYPEFSNVEVIEKVVDGHRLARPGLASQQIYQIMLDCWHRDPESRPTFAEIQQRLQENKSDYDEQF
eukprot:m.119480 g.119480  ORF g.119480 m.119480 type:complete len:715 (-) comp16151_c1_seq2:376-2520(-)